MTRYLPLLAASAMLLAALATRPAPADGTAAPTPTAVPASAFAPVPAPVEQVVLRNTPAPTPARTHNVRPASVADQVSITGVISWASESLGAHYFAISPYTGWPEGTRVEMCGPGGCAMLTSNDTGPIRRLRRLGDVAVGVWEQVCGVGRAMGLCVVTFTRVGK